MYWFDQYIFGLILPNNHQHILDCISILAAIVLNAGALGFEQVMTTIRDFFRDISCNLSQQDRETS